MDHKRAPKAALPIKGKTLLASLLSFFGIGQGAKRPRRNASGSVVWVNTPVGNHALPAPMQSEVMVCARNKRIRKDDKRKSVHHMQKKLGHHKFA